MMKAEQIHAILKAIYKDGLSVQQVADLLCLKYKQVSDVLLREHDSQTEAKLLSKIPVCDWKVKDSRPNARWALGAMHIGQIKEFQAENMEQVPVLRRRLTNRMCDARKSGMDFHKKVRGREIFIERIA